MPVTATEVKFTVKPAPVVLGSDVRRFELPDMDRHAAWFFPRFCATYTHLNERQAIGFLRSILYVNEFMFLFQENGVALAQSINSHALDSDPVIRERFVWVRDKENKDQVEAAAAFYDHFAKWGQRQHISTMIVEEDSDVPHELVVKRLGRVLIREQKFAKVAL